MPDNFTAMPTHRSPTAPLSRTWLPALVPSCQEKGQATGCDFVLNLDKTVGWLHQLLGGFQFRPVCEIVHPIREQVRSASAQAVPDLVTGGHLNGALSLTTL